MNQPVQPNALGSALAKVEPVLRSTWVRSRPTILATLKGLIGLGQEAATALEKQIAAAPASPAPLDFTPIQKAATTFWAKTQPWWVKIIAGVRSRLDTTTNSKLSDRALSGVLAGLTLLLLWLTTSLPIGAKQPPTPTARPKAPVTTTQPAAKLAPKAVVQTYPADVTNKTAFPKDLTTAPISTTPAPGANPPIAPTQTATPTPTKTAVQPPATGAPAMAAAPKPVAPVAPKAIATAPVPPKPVATQTVAKAPPKATPKPTPEQQLLSGFQSLSNGYAPNLIQTAQQDKPANTLKLTLGDSWYGLSSDQQDKLAAELLGKTQTLKVRSLQLLDTKGNLLARNPIVGNEMIVLLRQGA